MAIHAHSTTAPAVQPRLLPFVFRPVPPVDDPRSADELLEEIRRTIEAQEANPKSGDRPARAVPVAPLKTEPSDPVVGVFSREDTLLLKTQENPERPPLLPAPAPVPSLSAAFSRRRAIFGSVAVDEPDTATEARALHFRREMHQALDYGFALLDALDLPPLALDVIDDAIATLDALDASDEDREDDEVAEDDGTAEPSLASPERHPEVSRWQWSTPGLYVDRGPESSQLRWAEGAQHDGEVVNEDGDDLDGGEHDESDKEPSIGWPNDFRAVLSPDALQADHDPELVDEDGSEPGHEDEYHPWRFRRPDAVQIAAEACNG